MTLWSRLYNGQTTFRFVGRWKLWFALSGAVILVGMIALVSNGLNLGIDFEGGVSWEVPAERDADVDNVRDAVEAAGIQAPDVQSLGSADGEVIRVQAEEVGDADRREVTAVLAGLAGLEPADVSFNEVGPSWGDEITEKAVRALVVFLVLVSLYIAIRFEWRMAVATLAALVHDILVTVGVYALFGFPVTPATVIAFLTILGYSIYDGIVVFDRVDENARSLAVTGTTTYSQMVDDSLNQVLMRTLNTSITAILPIASLLFVGSFLLGATTLEEFALALFIGLLSGAYSSIFIASPTLAMLKEREARWRNLRHRVEGRAVPAGVGAAVAADGATRPAERREQPIRNASEQAAIRARARKKGKRR